MLNAAQLENYSSDLQTAIDSGATGNEILMGLRWHIEKLLKENLCADFIRAKAKRLHEELNKVLL